MCSLACGQQSVGSAEDRTKTKDIENSLIHFNFFIIVKFMCLQLFYSLIIYFKEVGILYYLLVCVVVTMSDY